MQARIPSLDGLRAVSIILVLYSHLVTFKALPQVDALAKIDIGFLGVLVFFVISGFIITTLLLKERAQTGDVSLLNFYRRRAVRILPALLWFLFGIAILAKLGYANASLKELALALTFTGNYRTPPFDSMQHLWSLSVEEQFYILWPFLFARMPRQSSIALLCGVVLVAPVARVFWLGSDYMATNWRFECIADGLAIGCLLAISQPYLRQSALVKRLYHLPVMALTPILIAAAAIQFSPLPYHAVQKTLLFAGVALWMDYLMQHPRSLSGLVLNSLPLVLIGQWSYSLYLWQQIFLSKPVGTQPYAWFPMNVALSFACALISYYFVEQPTQRWFRRKSAVRFPAKTYFHSDTTARNPDLNNSQLDSSATDRLYIQNEP